MKFEDYIKLHADSIHQEILKNLPLKEPQEHYQMLQEYTNRRGKYHRPALILLWSELYRGKKEEAFLPACAIQIAEDWLLMHDDWEDNNELRRGKPTAHKLYGDVFAVNAGDAVHAVMWKIVHQAAQLFPKEVGERFFQQFFQAIFFTIEGQYYDLKLAQGKDITKFTLDDYWRSIEGKSGCYSVYGPMQLGAVSAQQSEKIVEDIKNYGIPIGKAFQVKDDILDCTSTAEVLGKSIGTDIYEGTKTAILWHFVQNTSRLDLEKAKAIYAKDRKEKTAEEVEWVIAMFKKYGSIEYAEKLVDSFSQEALRVFEEQTKEIPESDIKETARDAIIKLAVRKK